jgi:2-polyprenyl-3-methyl-5-hydroxy-6-metoxy-1,4-benzoquinol methylase
LRGVVGSSKVWANLRNASQPVAQDINIEELFERASWPVHFRSQEPFPCMVCECTTQPAGEVIGRRTGRTFHLQRCKLCGFLFVNDPGIDEGEAREDTRPRDDGLDPDLDLERQESAKSIRSYEWRGVERVARHFFPDGGKWIDYGCGTGGLVKFVSAKGRFQMMGYDKGLWADHARAEGLPILREDELEQHAGTFDFVTSINLLERRADPVSELIRIRSLLKPRGVLFFLTSNTACAPKTLNEWSTLQPEIHVSYFNHVSIKIALERGRFNLQYPPWLPGFSDIVRYRTLRSLGFRKRSLLEWAIPIRPVARLLAWKNHLVDYTVGIAR